MSVFLLSHERDIGDNMKCEKIIGLYSSLDIVDKTICRYKCITGFKDYPDDFVVRSYETISYSSNDAISNNSVYLLQYEYDDYVTNLGVFSSCKGAETYMEELISKCYLKEENNIGDVSGNFTIDKYIINEDNWCEGFVTM